MKNMLRILPIFEVRSISIRRHLSKRQPACIFFMLRFVPAERRFNMANYFNAEKYPDPTAYTAIKNIEKQEKLKPKSKQKQKIRSEEAK